MTGSPARRLALSKLSQPISQSYRCGEKLRLTFLLYKQKLHFTFPKSVAETPVEATPPAYLRESRGAFGGPRSAPHAPPPERPPTHRTSANVEPRVAPASYQREAAKVDSERERQRGVVRVCPPAQGSSGLPPQYHKPPNREFDHSLSVQKTIHFK